MTAFRSPQAPTPPDGERRTPCPSARRPDPSSRARRRWRRAPRPPAGARPCRHRFSASTGRHGAAIADRAERPGRLMANLRASRVLERLRSAPADGALAIQSRRAPRRPAACTRSSVSFSAPTSACAAESASIAPSAQAACARTGASRSCSAAVTGCTPRGSSSAPSAQTAFSGRSTAAAAARRSAAAPTGCRCRPAPPRPDGRAWSESSRPCHQRSRQHRRLDLGRVAQQPDQAVDRIGGAVALILELARRLGPRDRVADARLATSSRTGRAGRAVPS